MAIINKSKRIFITSSGAVGAGLLAAIAAPAVVLRPALSQGEGEKLKETATDKKEEVTPPEDLMREHGVLDRVLLLYEVAIRKLSAKEDPDPALITRSAEVIRDFINNYHEKSEEEEVFPRFQKAGRLVSLVDTLKRQHDAGRAVTQTILSLTPSVRADDAGRQRLIAAMQSFIIMYRPHAAREDTDLFPKLRDLVSAHEYDAIAEDFEKKERQLFGEDGFEKMVAHVATIEQEMGIADLNQFTPREG